MFRKTFCPEASMLFSGKIRFHDVAKLTARCVLFATICRYSPLFTTIRDYSYYLVLVFIKKKKKDHQKIVASKITQ